jgi:ketosteroid isomerase-like protein
MAHPLEQIIRDAYAAFGRGDLDGYLQACTEDFAFHVPGEGGISGTYTGSEGMLDLVKKVMSLTEGTFREDVDDVLANDTHAVVLARHAFVRGGVQKAYSTAHVYEIRGGRLARCFEQPRDPAAFEDAWGAGYRSVSMK